MLSSVSFAAKANVLKPLPMIDVVAQSATNAFFVNFIFFLPQGRYCYDPVVWRLALNAIVDQAANRDFS